MIKNLIFDVGGVLFQYRWKEMFMSYGATEDEAFRIGWGMFCSNVWTNKLDAGLIEFGDVIEAFKEEFSGRDLELLSQFIGHAEEMVVYRPEVWDKISELKKRGYKTYILSNYSKELLMMHMSGCMQLWDMMDGAIVSSEVKVTKPNRGIYEKLLETYDLKAEECLFFDDRKDNVDGGIAAGIAGFHVTSRDALNEKLSELLI
ncbi:MAG: HAD family phosphatase [Eubacteriales bacterium]|nr:HAD family phosphatase [Eubacteriales bacterium]